MREGVRVKKEPDMVLGSSLTLKLGAKVPLPLPEEEAEGDRYLLGRSEPWSSVSWVLSLSPWCGAAFLETALARHMTLLSSLRTSQLCDCHVDSVSSSSSYGQYLLNLSHVPTLYVSLFNPYEIVCLMFDCQLILKMGFLSRSADSEPWDWPKGCLVHLCLSSLCSWPKAARS